jgi:hypothetical protein
MEAFASFATLSFKRTLKRGGKTKKTAPVNPHETNYLVVE